MIYDWPKPPQDGFLHEGHRNHPPFHVARQDLFKSLGTKDGLHARDKVYQPILVLHAISTCHTHTHISQRSYVLYMYAYMVRNHIYIYPHIMPYCNIHVFSMKSIFEQLKMMRKGCT